MGPLNQTKIKCLLSYSGIGYLGFILLGFEIGSFEILQASLIYMILYMVMSVCVFSVLLSLQLMRVIIMDVSSLSRYNFLITFTKGLTVFFHLTIDNANSHKQHPGGIQVPYSDPSSCVFGKQASHHFWSSSSFRGVQLNLKIGPRKLEFLIPLSAVTASSLEAKLIYTCLCSATPFTWTLKQPNFFILWNRWFRIS